MSIRANATVWMAALAALAASACATSGPSAPAAKPAAPSAPAAAAESTPKPAAPAAAAASVTPPSVFAVCAACHGTSANAPPGLGPNLFGVVGRKAGTAPDYDYSDAIKASGKVWTPDQLQAFLQSPNKVVPGNNMDYPGVGDAAAAKQIVDYLATLKR